MGSKKIEVNVRLSTTGNTYTVKSAVKSHEMTKSVIIQTEKPHGLFYDKNTLIRYKPDYSLRQRFHRKLLMFRVKDETIL